MELKAKVIGVLPEQTGTGKNGVWRKQEYILETLVQYPKKVCVEVWGDKISQFNLQKDDIATFGLDVESREYNGKWYTNVKIWKAQKEGSTSSGNNEGNQENNTPFVDNEPDYTPAESNDDDLPF